MTKISRDLTWRNTQYKTTNVNKKIKMDLQNCKRLICIEYPGLVKNPDRAIDTLGGIHQMSEVWGKLRNYFLPNLTHKPKTPLFILPLYIQAFSSDKASRLHLAFRPNNIYSKGTQGDRHKSSGVLMRVKVKRRRDEVRTEEVQVVGYTDTVYRFEGMCDYEMVPLMRRTPEAKHAELIYIDIIPTIDQALEDWLDNPQPLPYFLPPHTFTKFDSSISDRQLFKPDERNPRVKRYIRGAIHSEFNLSDPVPTQPTGEINWKQVTAEEVEVVRERFQKRPVWSATALQADIGTMSVLKLKFILPNIAYFFVSGPWRNVWLRFGYDPRKDFSSRHYQLMDLRLNRKTVFNIKSRYERKKEKAAAVGKNNVVSQLVYDDNAAASGAAGSAGAAEKTELYNPVFAAGQYHHLTWINLFQYCDIDVLKIQEMLEKVPDPMHGAKISVKTGWLPIGFDEECREILFEILKDYFQMEMQSKGQEEESGRDLNADELMDGEDDEVEEYDEDDMEE